MDDFPIRSLSISNFRRIEKTRILPFDAPVVLIHGSNGTGKTSILSALELGLTGSVRSMERQESSFADYLPFLGEDEARVQVDVADRFHAGAGRLPITVKGGRILGPSVLAPDAAKFYAERCYLDQASLGRLLELYQFREGKKESALARFVNEILGLEKLDALRAGLHDATDLRLLKKLAIGVENAVVNIKSADTQLQDQEAALVDIRRELESVRDATIEAVEMLRPGACRGMNDQELLRFIRTEIDGTIVATATGEASRLHDGITALGGRISALSERPSTQRITQLAAALDAAVHERETWDTTDGVVIAAWEKTADAVGVELSGDRRQAVQQVLARLRKELNDNEILQSRIAAARSQRDSHLAELDRLQDRLRDAHEHSSALVESLIRLRSVLDDNDSTCPVCDRDYGRAGTADLAAHLDQKLSRLTAQSQYLVDLRSTRDQISNKIATSDVAIDQLAARVLPVAEQKDLTQRIATLVELDRRLVELEPSLIAGAKLRKREYSLRDELSNLENASTEDQLIRAELSRYAVSLGISAPSRHESIQDAWQRLARGSAAEINRLSRDAEIYRAVDINSQKFSGSLKRQTAAVARASAFALNKNEWEARLAESKRRQTVAREVHEAATRARTAVVQRVFTESLNSVWKSVFTRLAPNEGFIPRFGIPTATKTALDIKLETAHRNGATGGSPQMMLSAGNLNTAALSLFLALHLAVEPLVPCLVFDDPVQAMDEVHVSQFAGLVRVLAKQHQRQVVIAVHERELFDYLALELSPAYEGDQLITIELGERVDDEDGGVTRYTWTRDEAIAA